MYINCPFCGHRHLEEFTYEGDATITWPALESQDLEAWSETIFQRRNPAGPHREYWQHVHGCRQFLIVERNTVTHEIHQVKAAGPWAGEAQPDSPEVGQ